MVQETIKIVGLSRSGQSAKHQQCRLPKLPSAAQLPLDNNTMVAVPQSDTQQIRAQLQLLTPLVKRESFWLLNSNSISFRARACQRTTTRKLLEAWWEARDQRSWGEISVGLSKDGEELIAILLRWMLKVDRQQNSHQAWGTTQQELAVIPNSKPSNLSRLQALYHKQEAVSQTIKIILPLNSL